MERHPIAGDNPKREEGPEWRTIVGKRDPRIRGHA
jgi:hypothetical protein